MWPLRLILKINLVVSLSKEQAQVASLLLALARDAVLLHPLPTPLQHTSTIKLEGARKDIFSSAHLRRGSPLEGDAPDARAMVENLEAQHPYTTW